MSYEHIIVERQDGVAKITLNRPQVLNALSVALLTELKSAVEAAAADDAVRCVLLTGSGRGFSSGADLMDPGAPMNPADPDLRVVLDSHYHPILETLRGMPKPYLCAVNGIAAGAGCNIALAADICLAAKSAKFIQVFARIALVPDAGGTWTVPRLIGRARAMRWMMTADDLPAETALEWGLITQLCDDDALQDEAMALAQRLAKGPTGTLAAIKCLVDASFDNDFSEQLEQEAVAQFAMGKAGDFKEGVMAFAQKRAADFQGN